MGWFASKPIQELKLEIPLDAATWVVNKENSIKQEMRTYKTVKHALCTTSHRHSGNKSQDWSESIKGRFTEKAQVLKRKRIKNNKIRFQLGRSHIINSLEILINLIAD